MVNNVWLEPNSTVTRVGCVPQAQKQQERNIPQSGPSSPLVCNQASSSMGTRGPGCQASPPNPPQPCCTSPCRCRGRGNGLGGTGWSVPESPTSRWSLGSPWLSVQCMSTGTLVACVQLPFCCQGKMKAWSLTGSLRSCWLREYRSSHPNPACFLLPAEILHCCLPCRRRCLASPCNMGWKSQVSWSLPALLEAAWALHWALRGLPPLC